MNHRKKRRLPERIIRTVKILNNLMREAHNAGLDIRIILDTKQLPFPIIDVRLFREIQYEEKPA
jgi:ribosomal protein S12 methylthiotransferase accessory factor YcaO